MRSVCVFCGSSAGSDPAYAELARTLGEQLAVRGLRLVYGGGSVGLMGVVADATLAAGGEVVGVIPQHLVDREVAHPAITEVRVTGSMHERKALMAELADAFVALPGGLGTLDELAEVLTWSQLGLLDKPCALLDVAGFYEPLVQWFDHLLAEGFVSEASRRLIVVEHDASALLDRLSARCG